MKTRVAPRCTTVSASGSENRPPIPPSTHNPTSDMSSGFLTVISSASRKYTKKNTHPVASVEEMLKHGTQKKDKTVFTERTWKTKRKSMTQAKHYPNNKKRKEQTNRHQNLPILD